MNMYSDSCETGPARIKYIVYLNMVWYVSTDDKVNMLINNVSYYKRL